jgi:Ricin-type beta-trefoil lectin domain-like
MSISRPSSTNRVCGLRSSGKGAAVTSRLGGGCAEKKARRWWVGVVAAVAAMSLLLAACGGSGKKPSGLGASIERGAKGGGSEATGSDCAGSVPPAGLGLDTMSAHNGGTAIQVGSTFYDTPGASAYLLVLDRNCLSKASFAPLPTSSMDTALTNDLKPFLATPPRYLAVLVGPASSGNSSGVVVHDKAFSYVFPVAAGLDDIKNMASNNYGGVENVGLKLTASGSRAGLGELYGQLRRPGQGHPFSFVQTDGVAFDTESQVTTKVAPGPTPPRAGSSYLLVSGVGSVLDVRGGSPNPEVGMVANGRTGLSTQQWRLEADPDRSGAFRIANVGSGLCLTVESTTAGAAAQQYVCGQEATGDPTSQLWRTVDRGDGTYAVASVLSDLVLSVGANSPAAGTAVVQNAYKTGSTGQVWTFEAPATAPAAPASYGVFVVTSLVGTVAAIPDSSTDAGRAAAAETETDLQNQRWQLVPRLAGGSNTYVYHEMINLNSRLCLTGAAEGAPVVQAACDGSSSQLWAPEALTDGNYQIGNLAGIWLAVADNSPATGSALVGTIYNGAIGQRWVFTPMTSPAQPFGVYGLASSTGAGIDVGKVVDNVDTLVAADQTETDSQQWMLKPAYNDAYPGYSQLVDVKDGQCVQPSDGVAADNKVLETAACLSGDDSRAAAQLWLPVAQPEGTYVLQSAQNTTLVISPGRSGAAPGSLIVEATNTGAATQRWALRPIQRTVTMTVGGNDYSLRFPLSWSGFAVLGLNAALETFSPAPPYVGWFPTNTGNSVLDQTGQSQLAADLSYLGAHPGYTVLVQSVGTPHPTTSDWGNAAKDLTALGGNPQIFDRVGPATGGYALAGCSGCGSDHATQASGPAGQVAGTLTRAWNSTLQAGLASTTDSTGFSLFSTANQAASPWPVPANPGQTQALVWVSQQLNLGNPNAAASASYCQTPATWNVRAAYCNLSVSWTDKRADLNRLSRPADAAFSDDDLAAVKDELDTEFEWVTQVRNLIANLQNVFYSSSATANFDLAKATSDVVTATKAAGPMVVDPYAYFASLLKAESAVLPIPEVKDAVDFVTTSLEISDNTSEQSDGTDTLGTIQTTAANLGIQLRDRFSDAQANLGSVLNLLVTDYGRLLTANLQIEGGAWQIGYPLSSDINQALALSTRQWLYTQLLPNAGFSLYMLNPPPGKTLANLACRTYVPGAIGKLYYPFQGFAAGAQFPLITSLSASGAPQYGQYWAIGKDTGPPGEFHVGAPDSDTLKTLFDDPPAGLGLDPVVFYTSAPWVPQDFSGKLPANCSQGW